MFYASHSVFILFPNSERLWHRCFPVRFSKFLRTPFLQNTSGRLLLVFAETGYQKASFREGKPHCKKPSKFRDQSF